jgi:hypothetical protein
MANSIVQECAYPSCRCQVVSLSGDKYCSELCKDAGADETGIGCGCGHPPCANGSLEGRRE